MSTKDEIIILPEDDAAASIQTVTGWVSREGRFVGDDERQARWEGSTHKRCEKHDIIHARNSYCETCYNEREIEKFMAMPIQVWNGEPICTHDGDKYFFGASELYEYCEFENVHPKEILLVFAEPEYADTLDPHDHYSDALSDGADLPDAIVKAFEVLNAAIEACGEPLCWWPGKVRVDPKSLCDIELKGEAEKGAQS